MSETSAEAQHSAAIRDLHRGPSHQSASVLHQPTNSPFHQPARDNAGNVLPHLAAHTQAQPTTLSGRALAAARAWARLTAAERAGRDPPDDHDWMTDPNIVHLPDGNGGTIYKDRATGQILTLR
jgi:hypothetical protein